MSVRLFYCCGALPQPRRTTALCTDGNIRLCYVIMLAAALTATWYIHILLMCKYCRHLRFIESIEALKTWWCILFFYSMYNCNCTVASCLSGTFSLLCEMGTQCLRFYLNTLIKQCRLLLLLPRWSAAYSIAIAHSTERVGPVFIHTSPTQLIYPPNNWYLLR